MGLAKPRVKVKCDKCGKIFTVGPGVLTQRLKRSKSGKLFCCKKHQTLGGRKPNNANAC